MLALATRMKLTLLVQRIITRTLFETIDFMTSLSPVALALVSFRTGSKYSDLGLLIKMRIFDW
jgi:hypothetical protein